MEFRQRGQSNQRRRRVLKDDPTAATDDGTPDSGGRRARASESLRRYSDHALAEHQMRVTDLIPQRPWTYLVLVLGGILSIVTVEALYLHHSVGERIVGRSNLSALDPTHSGSIAGWVSSMTLGLAALAGILVFTLRRHKIDDYRGRYRMWLPMVGLFLVASMDASTGLHRAGRGLVLLVAQRYGDGTSLGASPHAWWVGLCLFGATVVGVRLGIEMRHSRAAVAKLILALGCYVALALIEWRVLLPDTVDMQIVAASAARLLGDLCLCLATTSFARYVYLDAQGIIAARRLSREKKRRQAAAEKAARKEAAAARKAEQAEARRVSKQNPGHESATGDDESDNEADEAPRGATSPTRGSSTSPTPASGDQRPPTPAAKPGPLAGRGSLGSSTDDADDDDDGDGDDDQSQLSRAERRRLRKLQRREMRKAA